MSLSWLRTATGSALAALAVVTASAAPAAAHGATPSTPGLPTPGQQIAAALRVSPLYVDPSLNATFPPAIRADLLRQISRAPAPVYILAVPLPSGEWGNGDQLATVVHDYLGRAGIYLTINVDFRNEIDAYTWPSDPYGTDAAPYHAADAAMAADLAPGIRDAALPRKFSACIGLISGGQAVPAYQAALRQLGVPQVAGIARHRDAGPSAALLVVLIVLVLIGLALAGAGAWMWLVRRGQAQPPSTWVRPAFAVVRAASVSEPARRLLAWAGLTSRRVGPGSHRRPS